MQTTLDEPAWRERRLAHEERADAWIVPHLSRRSRGVAHPVDDFLFTYYSYSPASLRRWHPGHGVTLTGPGVTEFREVFGYVVTDDHASVDPALAGRRLERCRRIRELLVATASRPAKVGCFGLHEWAMVYQQRGDVVRHAAYPLRLGPRGTDEVVESHRIVCTHHDAFRFFTAPARPLNVLQPTRQERSSDEQPGCLHATMDLYKWAYQLAPLTSSELVADCFALAYDVRQVDMSASPYDLSGLGVAPLRIETTEGKQQYVGAQRAFADRAAPLRQRLIEQCDSLLDHVDSVGSR
jgi:hypothetical protein